MRKLCLGKNCALLITDRLIRKYFTGIDIAEGYLVVSDNPVYFTDARYFSAAKEKIEPLGIKASLFLGLDSINEELKAQDIKKLFLDYERTTLSDYESYKVFGIEMADGTSFIRDSRTIKTESEIADIKKACEIIQRAYHDALNIVKEGITENELKKEIERLMVEYGAEGPAFDTIVAFGDHAAVPHHETGDTKLTLNTEILVDTGCKVNGYCSDLTRMAFFGTPSKEFTDAYDSVLKANLIAEEKITDNMLTNVADGFARNLLKEKGLDKYFTHSLGHGVGIEIHEFPALSPKKSDTLKNGMVFTIEPGVYIDGVLGIRIEDTVVLNNGKLERLFTDGKDLILIKK